MGPIIVIILCIVTAIVLLGAAYSISDEYKELQRKQKKNNYHQ